MKPLVTTEFSDFSFRKLVCSSNMRILRSRKVVINVFRFLNPTIHSIPISFRMHNTETRSAVTCMLDLNDARLLFFRQGRLIRPGRCFAGRPNPPPPNRSTDYRLTEVQGDRVGRPPNRSTDYRLTEARPGRCFAVPGCSDRCG
jgi:hypothetical protein